MPSDTAYFEFLRGRYLEGQGKLTEALEAYERAAALDSRSAHIQAEIAALYARQNKSAEAIRAAKRAIELDSGNSEAHWVLGTIFATALEAEREAASGRRPGESAPDPSAETRLDGEGGVEAAIEHLELARTGRPFDNALRLTLARLYLARRSWDQAIDTLNYIVEREPDAAEAGYLLAQAYDASGQRPQAITALERVVAAQPRFFRGLLDLADLYIREQRWDDAARAYKTAAEAYPGNLDLKLRHAAALVNAGNPAAARAVLDEVDAKRPDEPRALLLRVDAERALRNYDAAERAARKLMELQPTQLYGPQALARVLGERRQYREIVNTLEPVVAKASTNSESSRALMGLRVTLATAYQELREFDKAVATFEAAVRADPDDAIVPAYLAQAYVLWGKPEKGVEVARAARVRHPNDLRLLGAEAAARLKAGQRDEAVALYQDALAARRDNPELPVAFAGLLLEAKDFARAEQVLEEAASRFPKSVAIPFQLGAVFEEQRKYDEAERAFRQALSIDPRHAPTLNYLGYMFAERGQRLDEAVGMLKQAVDQDPHNGSYLDSLGWAYYKQGALDRAREYLVRAGEQLPDNSVVQDHVGDVLYALRDTDGAVAAWQRALSGDGRSIERRDIERKIEKARAR